MIVGDGATDPVAESGDTLRNSIGVGATASGTVMQIYNANTSGNVRIARNLAVGFVNSEVPGANLDVNGNAYISGATTIGGALSFGSLASTSGCRKWWYWGYFIYKRRCFIRKWKFGYNSISCFN